MARAKKRKDVSIEVKIEFKGAPRPVLITLDTSVGTFYVRVERGAVSRTIEHQEGVLADVNSDGSLLGVEFLRPAEFRDLDKIARRYKAEGRRARDAVEEASHGLSELLRSA